MMAQVSGRARPWVTGEVIGRGDHQELRLAHDTHRQHVAIDLFAKANASIVAFADDVGGHFDDGNVQLDARIFLEKTRQYRFNQQVATGGCTTSRSKPVGLCR